MREDSIHRKEKEIEEKRQLFLSHFSKNRKGDVSKDKEVVILSDEEEQAKSNTNVSAATSPITLEQISQLVVSGQEKILATVQNMIDKSLGKQPLIDDSGTPRPNIGGAPLKELSKKDGVESIGGVVELADLFGYFFPGVEPY